MKVSVLEPTQQEKENRTITVEFIPENIEEYDEAVRLCSANGLRHDEWYWDGKNVRLKSKIQTWEINITLE